MRPNKYEYDAFISHAVEDKIPIANELCAKLEAAGLKIWYSGKELGVGDSIEKTIEKGLNRSRYGIVIFSPTYLAKNWTIREFYTLLAKEIEEHKVILPVLYNVCLDDLKKKDLLMADRFAVNADKGIDVVVERLVREIQRSNGVKITRRPWLSKIGFFLILSLLANVALLSKSTFFTQSSPAISRKTEAVNDQSAGTETEKFLNEVQGMFSLLNTCSCNPHPTPPASDEKTRVAQNVLQRHEKDGAAGAGRTMTMAVIFQIETADDAARDPEAEDDKKLSTLSQTAGNSAFVSVKNHELISSRNETTCLHTAGLGE